MQRRLYYRLLNYRWDSSQRATYSLLHITIIREKERQRERQSIHYGESGETILIKPDNDVLITSLKLFMLLDIK